MEKIRELCYSDMRAHPCIFHKFNHESRVKVREGRIGEITEILAWYEYINDVILDHLDDEIKSTDRSGVWRYLISFKVRGNVLLSQI